MNKRTKTTKENTKIKIGSLVEITLRSLFDSSSHFWHWNTNLINTNKNFPQLPNVPSTPWGIGSNNVYQVPCYTNLNEYEVSMEGGVKSIEPVETTQTVDRTPYYKSASTSQLKELYRQYIKNSSGSGSGTNNTLGMTIWNGNPKDYGNNSIQKLSKAYTVSSSTLSYPTTTTMTTAVSDEYSVTCYKTLQDCILGYASIIKEKFDEAENKPTEKKLSGIVVDEFHFSSQIKSAKGEVADLGYSTDKDKGFYKVLINETSCLWFSKEDISLLKK